MTFRVIWIQSALNDLMRTWNAADSAARKQITSAIHALDKQLERDPSAICESRGPGEWVCFSDPVGARVEIDEPNRVVWVLSLWRSR